MRPDDYDGESYERTHEWTFRGRTVEWELSVPVSTYEYCGNRHRVHEYGVYIADPIQDPLIEDLSDRFDRFAARRGLNERSRLIAVTRFVQSLSYTLDVDDTGHTAYPKYPAETLIHQRGDCEDGTILLGTLLDRSGFDVAVIVFPDAHHMLLGVALERDDAGYVEYDGTRYCPIETTNTALDIGQFPTECRGAKAEVQLPEDAPVLVHEWEAVPESPGIVEVAATVANFGRGGVDSLAVQIEFETRDGGTVVRRQLNHHPSSLAPGESTRYDRRLELPISPELRGRLVLGVDGIVHDCSESEWH